MTELRSNGVGICGVGTVTGYGWGRKYLWDGLVTGESCVVRQDGFEAEFPDSDVWLGIIPDGGDPADGRTKFTRALQASAREAIEDAIDRGWRPSGTVGLVHAFVLGEVEGWRDFYLKPESQVRRRDYIGLMPSTPLSSLMTEYGFHGPCMSVLAMCASGNAALLTAKMWIDSGVADDVLVVATDVSGTPENVRRFVDVGVLVVDQPSLEACRPFQDGSRGFTGGEASVALMLSGQTREAYARVLGGSMSHDAHHVISLDPERTHVAACFEKALDDAGVSAGDLVYMNAHGPGTAQCDAVEGGLLDEMFPAAEGVYAFKPLVGHCQGAAAAVEVAVECLSREEGVIPAPPAVAPAHPRLISGAVPRRPGLTLKSSLGMGGYNTAVVIADG